MKLTIKIGKGKTIITICLTLVFLALLAILLLNRAYPAQTRDTLAAWQPTSKPSDSIMQYPSANKIVNEKTALTRSNESVLQGGAGGTTKDGPAYSYYSRGWNAENQWWQLSEISTRGYNQIEISFAVRSSDTGPKNFRLEYSADGEEWLPLTNSSNAEIKYAIDSDSKFHRYGPFALSAAVNNLDRIFIRFLNTDLVSITGDTTKSAGTSSIADIIITGAAIK